MSMTPRQRLLSWLGGEPVDRMPVWLLFPYAPTSYYVDVRTHPLYRPVFEASKGRAVMLNRRSLPVPLFTPEVVIIQESSSEGGVAVTRQRYRYGGHELVEETRTRSDGTVRKPLLCSDDDLRILLSFPIERDEAVLRRHLEEALVRYEVERAEFPLDYGAMMLDMGEPIGFLYQHSDLEMYAIWSLTQDAAVRSFLDAAMERLRVVYDFALERKLAEVYFLVGSELASPPLVSRSTFQRWIVPYARELIERIHAHGAFAIQHYHGQIGQILPDFLTMGADALHTIEEPPVGDCAIEAAFEVVGDRLGLIGCIQYDCFRSMSTAEMRAAVQDQMRRLEGRRFMLSPSAGPYEENPGERVIANYLAFLDAVCS